MGEGERTRGVADGTRLRLLGPVTARTADGTPLGLGPNQQQALLAVLVLRAGRSVPVPELCDALWGDQAPPRAVGTLRTYASRLRALFEPGRAARAPARVLVHSGGGYALRLSRPLVDVDAFEDGLAEAARRRAAGATGEAYRVRGEALALWAGSPLAGLPGPYAAAQRERLTGLWLAAREDHYQDALELGLDRDTAAVAALRAFAAEHPLRERAQALLMRALYRTGRSGEALAVYEAARATLALELGAVPGPELSCLHDRLRWRAVRAPGPGGPSGAAPAPAAGAPPALTPAPASAPFVGRAAESDLLVRLLCATAAGVPVAVLTGMPGIGKTALAAQVAERVAAHFPDGVLRADLGAGHPAALDGLLRALGVPGAAVPDGAEEGAALYRSLLAERRVLLLLDNARDTRGLLPLLPGTPGCAALVTAASRGLVVPGARLIEVPELDEALALELLGASAGPPRVRQDPVALRELALRCRGLPLALHLAGTRLRREPGLTVRALAARGGSGLLARLRADGRSVEDGFRRRAEGLSAAALRALRATAAAPGGFGAPEAGALLGTSASEAAAAIEELVGSGLLGHGSSGRYRCHPLVREFARHRLGLTAAA
ncbi:BTAD domain-containing putative transcriptional regulator [Streptomyces sp. G-G2]|uniref:AfsR/SARP family transcriptional regulator n=1 Tax=Streptomyces sp. G-G2 TaxID=3046201 RepID=UPI0024B94747|nr:BTAD domain-containing putative transcriptional regulator [Streptomyces sp. G-G2]MDJ0382046.1 BTAD domain-containing putative transcriptional regulator [Streptomyces sp. G-G2]